MELASRREKTSCEYPRTPSLEEDILAFTKMRTTNTTCVQTNNTSALLFLLKMRGKTDKKLVNLSKDICEYQLLEQITINRLASLSSQQRLFAVGVNKMKSIPKCLLKKGNTYDRPVCFQIIESKNKIFYLESRHAQFGYKFNATIMEPGNSVCISSVLVNSKSTLHNNQGKSQCSNIDDSSMENSTLLSKSSCTQLFLASMPQDALTNPKGECSAQFCLLVQSCSGCLKNF